MHAPRGEGEIQIICQLSQNLTGFNKPAPETEEEMMVEVFKYTERVVNMIRPRKLLFMAIGESQPSRHVLILTLNCSHRWSRT
jgi:hypothetical protein